MSPAETLVRQWQKDCLPMTDPADLEELERRIAALIPERALVENAVKQAVTMFSSPTVGKGDIHGGQTGYIIYERDGLPFVVSAIVKAVCR